MTVYTGEEVLGFINPKHGQKLNQEARKHILHEAKYEGVFKREYLSDGGMVALDILSLGEGEKINAREIARRHGRPRRWASHHVGKLVKRGLVVRSGNLHCCQQTYFMSSWSLAKPTLISMVEWWADHTEREWRLLTGFVSSVLTRYKSSRFSRRRGRALRSDGCLIPFKDSLVCDIGEVLVESEFLMDFDSFREDSLSLMSSGEVWFLNRLVPYYA